MPDIHKPFRLSCIQNVQPVGDRQFLYVTLSFGFDLMKPDEIVPEAKYLEVSTSQVPLGEAVEPGFGKGCPEILIAGESQAPEGTRIKAQDVSVTVGPVTKTARVFGDRYWVKESDRIVLRDAEPYETMPLKAELAYGSETHSVNPKGQGHNPAYILDHFGYAALPNIEDPRRLILQPTDRPEPVLFGPLSAEHPERKSRLGTPLLEDARKSWPGMPAGFDPHFFNVAPPDQQAPGELTGNEPIRITGMSAKHPVVTSRLPGLRPRVFAIHDKEAKRFTELSLRLETVWIFGTAGIGGLYYRGMIEVTGLLAKELAAVVLAAERMQDAPRDPDYYAHIYRLRTDPDEGAMHTMNDSQLMPPLPEAEVAAVRARMEELGEEHAAKFDKQMEFRVQSMIQDSNLPDMFLPDLDLPKAPRVPIPAAEDLIQGKVDLAAYFKEVSQVMDDADAMMAARSAAEVSKAKALGMPIPDDKVALVEEAVKAKDPKVGDVFKSVIQSGGIDMPRADFYRKMAEDLAPPPLPGRPGLEEIEPGAVDSAFSKVDEILRQIPGLDTVKGDDELFEIARAKALDLPEADPFYKVKQQMETVRDIAASQQDGQGEKALELLPDDLLSGKVKPQKTDFNEFNEKLFGNMTPKQQEGFDKINEAIGDFLPKSKGQDLPPILALAKARESMPVPEPDIKSVDELVDRIEKYANTTEAGFFEEHLDEEERKELLDATHERSQIPDVVYPLDPYSENVRKRLGDLVAEHVAKGDSFARRDIAGADLSGADLSGLDLYGILMEDSRLAGANVSGTNFEGAALSGVDFTDANASRCNFSNAGVAKISGRNARFDRSVFDNRLMLEIDLPGASFKGCTLENMVLENANLAGADFEGARILSCVLINCDFSEASLKNAYLEKNTIVGCEAGKSDWSGAEFDRNVLVDLKARGSRWSGAVFSKTAFAGETELQGSFFDRSRISQTSFQKLNLEQACFLRADLRDAMFVDCSIQYGDFRLAKARRALFNESDLRHSDYFGADLHLARLSFCDARNTSFRGANLFACDMMEARIAGADLSLANLGMTIMELPSQS